MKQKKSTILIFILFVLSISFIFSEQESIAKSKKKKKLITDGIICCKTPEQVLQVETIQSCDKQKGKLIESQGCGLVCCKFKEKASFESDTLPVFVEEKSRYVCIQELQGEELSPSQCEEVCCKPKSKEIFLKLNREGCENLGYEIVDSALCSETLNVDQFKERENTELEDTPNKED